MKFWIFETLGKHLLIRGVRKETEVLLLQTDANALSRSDGGYLLTVYAGGINVREELGDGNVGF